MRRDGRFRIPGVDGQVNAILVDGNDIYIGGYFTSVANVPCRNVARWDGTKWAALGLGIAGGRDDEGGVKALAMYKGALYAAGDFTIAGGRPISLIARWDGMNWWPLGSGLTGPSNWHLYVTSMVEFQGNLMVGGLFLTAGGSAAFCLAGWDGAKWTNALISRLDHPGANNFGVLYCLGVKDGKLLIGGSFSKVNGVPAMGFAYWDGKQWLPLGDIDAETKYGEKTEAIHVHEGTIYVVRHSGGNGGIARWSGNRWDPFAEMNDGTSAAFCSIGPDLYVGGVFTSIGGQPINKIARWDGVRWTEVGQGVGISGDIYSRLEAEVMHLASRNARLLVGGYFSAAGSLVVDSLAEWDGQNWRALGDLPGKAVSGPVIALAVNGQKVFAAGDFFAASSAPSCVAAWDGNEWSDLGGGIPLRIPGFPNIRGSGVFYTGVEANRAAADGDTFYVAGFFRRAGTVTVNGLARWDGNRWSSLGTWPLNAFQQVLPWVQHPLFNCLYASGGYVWVGTSDNGLIYGDYHGFSRIREWDGLQWRDLASDYRSNLVVFAMAGGRNELYLGGLFKNLGGVANNIAKWDGRTFTSLGTGVNGAVNVVKTVGKDVYVGGSFTHAGALPVNRIAKWDGRNWSALGDGLTDSVFAMESNGTNLFVGGTFTAAGGIAANYIAQWDGSRWSGLGSGVNGHVYALALVGQRLYIGGQFSTAGEKPSRNFAIWHGVQSIDGLPRLYADIRNDRVRIFWNSSLTNYVLQRAENLAQATWSDVPSSYAIESGRRFILVEPSGRSRSFWSWGVPLRADWPVATISTRLLSCLLHASTTSWICRLRSESSPMNC